MLLKAEVVIKILLAMNRGDQKPATRGSAPMLVLLVHLMIVCYQLNLRREETRQPELSDVLGWNTGSGELYYASAALSSALS